MLERINGLGPDSVENLGIFTIEEEAELFRLLLKVAENNQFTPSQRTFEALHFASGSRTAVEVLITDGNGRVLLVDRHDELWDGWHVLGGYIPANAASISEACARVAKREVGQEVKFEFVLATYKWKPGEHPYGFPTSIVCVCTISDPTKIATADTRRWFDAEDVPAQKEFLAPCHHAFVDEFFRMENNRESLDLEIG
jgi:ADP-ribose pyrophosphatase YjhB (NUDIX family)